MKTKTSYLFLAAIAVAMCSCEPLENDDVVQSPDKDGSVETSIKISHFDKFDVLTTTRSIWTKKKLYKTIVSNDTLPSLGTTTQVGENSEGEEKKVVVPKNYELYITVK